jgi:hypothetical protein
MTNPNVCLVHRAGRRAGNGRFPPKEVASDLDMQIENDAVSKVIWPSSADIRKISFFSTYRSTTVHHSQNIDGCLNCVRILSVFCRRHQQSPSLRSTLKSSMQSPSSTVRPHTYVPVRPPVVFSSGKRGGTIRLRTAESFKKTQHARRRGLPSP